MKATVWGVFAGAAIIAVVCSLIGRDATVFAQRPGSFDAAPELITLTTPLGDAKQQLTVIDPRSRVLSIYHVELASGAVTLKSVRNIHWDLQMSEFNATSPLPREIRGMMEQR